MAKFKYRMQSILNIKEKLEEQAKNEFAAARLRLDEEEEKLNDLLARKAFYEEEGRRLREDSLNILDLNENKIAIERMKEFIAIQQIEVNRAAALLEQARINLTNVMQEAQIHNKLKEKAFDQFKKEINAQESKEVDELTSYTYGAKLKEDSDNQ
ncbi:MAG: flagellar export protein FliJ [Lachnospiraceae bacterium]|nr:flagellar export protein FliJ [Lachnospiraceae bacterium]